MFYVNNNPILQDPLDVLIELKHQLELNNIFLFKEFKVGEKNIQFNCPIHNNGQEKTPSCGILIKRDEKTKSGLVNCFTCGYKANLEQMISHCFGFNDFGAYGKNWLIKNFLIVSIENRKDIELDFIRRKKEKTINYIKEEELNTYRYYHRYMFERGLTEELIQKFDVGYDANFMLRSDNKEYIYPSLTFPVKDFNGNVLFLVRRAINQKIYHYPKNIEKSIYGLFETKNVKDEIIICEGVFDVLTCWKYGKKAIGLLGLGTQKQYEQLKTLKARKFIIGLDNDKAGNAATKKLKQELSKHKLITQYRLPNNKDINNLNLEEFNQLEEIF